MSTDDYISRPHDLFTRQSLERLEVAKDIVSHYLPRSLVQELNLDTLTLVSESFVDADLRASQSDVLYLVQFRDGHWGQIYILFEHKSHSDPMTAFQLLKYVVRIWERQQRQKEPLTPVVPVVLYHGTKSWTAARSLRELIGGPDVLQKYIPDFTAELLDLSTYRDEELQGQSLTRATLLLLKYIFRAELRLHLTEIFQAAAQQRGDEELLDVIRSSLTYVAAAARQMESHELVPLVQKSLGAKGDNVVTSILEQWIEKGRNEGRNEGREEGREEGRLNTLRADVRAVLEVRFPDHGPSLDRRIDGIDSADVLQRLLRVSLTADSTAEIDQWLASGG